MTEGEYTTGKTKSAILDQQAEDDIRLIKRVNRGISRSAIIRLALRRWAEELEQQGHRLPVKQEGRNG